MKKQLTVTANYYFSHDVLKKLFLTNKIKDVVRDVHNDMDAFNDYLKNYLIKSLDETARVETNVEDFTNHEFDIKVIKFSNCYVFCLNMPEPKESGDAYCVGIGCKNNKYRYFTLELTYYGDRYGYVIAEDDLNGNYSIIKKVNVPSEDTFINSVKDITSQDLTDKDFND